MGCHMPLSTSLSYQAAIVCALKFRTNVRILHVNVAIAMLLNLKKTLARNEKKQKRKKLAIPQCRESTPQPEVTIEDSKMTHEKVEDSFLSKDSFGYCF